MKKVLGVIAIMGGFGTIMYGLGHLDGELTATAKLAVCRVTVEKERFQSAINLEGCEENQKGIHQSLFNCESQWTRTEEQLNRCMEYLTNCVEALPPETK